ncbi:MAG: helicase-related protein [Spirochaetes bacterium]|nr:helicase-related protein [Spirochaetota bacterium]
MENKMLNRFFGSGMALQCIHNALKDAKVVRIATAYFEPSGYNLLRTLLKGKDVRLLVGRNEGVELKIESIVDQFIEDLAASDIEDKTQFIEELCEALKAGYFTINLNIQPEVVYTTLSPRFLYQHAKLYIADIHRVVVTSANFTYSGLIMSREAGVVVEDIEDVIYFVNKFDEYFNQGQPIAQELLEKLQDILKLYSPYVIYIRSLLLLYEIPNEELSGKLPPLTGYQKPIVSRLLRTIEEHNGSYLVASTGLGKTVMAAHIAAYLAMNKSINSVIVLCPAGLKRMWRRILRAARVSSEEFSYYILSLDDFRKSIDVAHLLQELSHIDENTLIILDESHHMRNIGSTENIRLSHQRILDAVYKRNAKILLMTATPYSTSVDDINTQLKLLPPKKEQGLYGINNIQWSITTPSELPELPPVVVLTAPTVVKHYSSVDDEGNRYVLFLNNEKRYFPHTLHFQTIEYMNQGDSILQQLLEGNLLYRRSTNDNNNLFDDNEGIRDPLWEAQIVHQACSSLKQLDELLNKLSYEGGFEKIRFHNQKELSSFAIRMRQQLQSMLYEKDDKINKLVELIQRFNNEKIVVFCHFRETARYVNEAIKKIMPLVNVETTVDVDPNKIEAIIQRFAPIANKVDYIDEDEERNGDEVQILVATGAMSEGFNFQDARILINFDLPWTVLTLAQRMGRILRPWHQPREVYVFNFIPSTMKSNSVYHAVRWKDRLLTRNNEIRSFADIPVLVAEGGKDYEMVHLAKSIALFGDHELNLDEVLQFIERADNLHSSSFVDDIAQCDELLKKEILRFPSGIRSIKLSTLKESIMLYVLFKCKNRHYPVLFDGKGKILYDSERMDDIMHILRCTPDEEAVYNAQILEKVDMLLIKAKNEWLTKHKFNMYEVMIDCYCVILS